MPTASAAVPRSTTKRAGSIKVELAANGGVKKQAASQRRGSATAAASEGVRRTTRTHQRTPAMALFMKELLL
jgi:hypothetical protein